MDVLKDMFPQHEEDVLRLVLEDNHGDLDAALAVLLSSDFEPRSREPVVEAPQEEVHRPKPKLFKEEWMRSDIRSITPSLEQLLQEERHTDVELRCINGELFKAHQLVLGARCQYLSILLSTVEPDPEREMRKVLDVEMTPKVCRVVLTFLYTDRVDIRDEDIPEVHEASTYLDLDYLRRKCEGADAIEPNLPKDFLALYEDPEHTTCDIELEAQGTVFYAHKLILSSASEYFKEMFSSEFAEKSQKRVSIPNVTAEDMKMILECVYTDGHVRRDVIDVENAYPTFLLANAFLLPSLQSLAESVMFKHLDEENVLALLSDAARLSPALRRHCLEFIARNYESISETEAYKSLPSVIQLEVEHFAARRNEESFTALIASMSDVEVGDFQSLVQDEIVSFLDSQLGEIEVPDLVDTTDTPFGQVDFTLSDINLSPPPPIPKVKEEDKNKNPAQQPGAIEAEAQKAERRRRRQARRQHRARRAAMAARGAMFARGGGGANRRGFGAAGMRGEAGRNPLAGMGAPGREGAAARDRRLQENDNDGQYAPPAWVRNVQDDEPLRPRGRRFGAAPAKRAYIPVRESTSSEEEEEDHEPFLDAARERMEQLERLSAALNDQVPLVPAAAPLLVPLPEERATAAAEPPVIILGAGEDPQEEEVPAFRAPRPRRDSNASLGSSTSSLSSSSELDPQLPVMLDRAAEALRREDLEETLRALGIRLVPHRFGIDSDDENDEDEAAPPGAGRAYDYPDTSPSDTDDDDNDDDDDDDDDDDWSDASSTGSSSDSSDSDSTDEEPQFFNKNSISAVFSATKLSILASDITICINKAKWSYVKQTFPRATDQGTADIELVRVRFALTFSLKASSDVPHLELHEFSADMDDVRIKFSNSSADWIYNILVKAFRSTLKQSIIQAVQTKLAQSLTQLTSHLNRMSDRQSSRY